MRRQNNDDLGIIHGAMHFYHIPIQAGPFSRFLKPDFMPHHVFLTLR
jgi:hypothetical protein